MTARTPQQVRLMILMSSATQDGKSQTVETTLLQALQNAGYTVVDAAAAAQARQRHADLLKRPEVEAAKRVGARLEADLVLTGTFTSRTVDKTYDTLGGKKVAVSQADVSAKVIAVHSGQILLADTASARKPFDTTGEPALQAAAETLAQKLLQGLSALSARETLAYQIVVLNLTAVEAQALPRALSATLPGVKQVRERSFTQGTLELDVQVVQSQAEAFTLSLLTQASDLGVGRFTVLAREGDTVYLRRVARAASGPSRPAVSSGTAGSVSPGGAGGDSQVRQGKIPGVDTVSPSAVPGGYRAGYGKSWAVVIGINQYHKWPKLSFAVADAQSIATVLKQRGFDEVRVLLDGEATQQKILGVLGDELARRTEANDRVVIFFAGHGQTEDLANGSKMGYIIPVEGELDNYYATAISMSQLQQLSDRLSAKHILYVMDACFSGLLLRLRGDTPPAASVMEQTTLLTRQVLTAGAEGEKAIEMEGHGLFTRMLLEGLQSGSADADGDGHVTASELYQFVAARVAKMSRNTQNPAFGRLGVGPGEFLF